MLCPHLSKIWIYLCVVAAILKTVRTDTCPTSSPGAEAHIGFNPDTCVIIPNQTNNSVLCYDPLNTTYSENDLRWFQEDAEVVFGTGMGDAFQRIEPLYGYNMTRIYFSVAYQAPGCYTCRSITNSTVYRDLEAYEYVNTTLIPPSATTTAPMIPGALCMDPTTQPPTTTNEQTTAVMPTAKQTEHSTKYTTFPTVVVTEHSTKSTTLTTIKQERSTSTSTLVATDQGKTVTTETLPKTTSGSITTQRTDAIIGLVTAFAISLVWL